MLFGKALQLVVNDVIFNIGATSFLFQHHCNTEVTPAKPDRLSVYWNFCVHV